MRSTRLLWLAAAAGTGALAQDEQHQPQPQEQPRELTLPSTLTPGDGALLFSPDAASGAAWVLSNASDPSDPSAPPAAASADSADSPDGAGAALPALVASTNATNASASFAFFGTGFAVVGTGAGELHVTVQGFADGAGEADPRRAPDWAPKAHGDASVNTSATGPAAGPAGMAGAATRELASARYGFNASDGGVLYSDNGTAAAEWKNVTVRLASGAVALQRVQVQHGVRASANRAQDAPLRTLPAVWWANGSLYAGDELQFHGPWAAQNLTSGTCTLLPRLIGLTGLPDRALALTRTQTRTASRGTRRRWQARAACRCCRPRTRASYA